MKSLPQSLFRFFCFSFFAYSVAFMDYWNANIASDENLSSKWMMRTAALLVGFSLFIWLFIPRFRYKGIHLICLLWLFLMPLFSWINGVNIPGYIYPLLWPLIYEMTYMFCRQQERRTLQLGKLYVAIALVGLYLFFLTRIDIYQGRSPQTNTIYFVLLTLPWLLYNRKSQTQLTLMIVFSLFVFLSLKRSAMLSLAVMWFFYTLNVLRSRRGKILSFFLLVAVFGGISLLFNFIDEQYGGLLDERVNREETDQGRNRLAIWEVTRAMISATPPAQMLVGHGHFAVRRDSPLGISAHNDFLEVIYDYGLIIFVLYLGLWAHVIRRSIYLYRVHSPLFLPYSTSLSIFIVMSMVSHLILYTSYILFLVMFWAAAETLIEKEQSEQKTF